MRKVFMSVFIVGLIAVFALSVDLYWQEKSPACSPSPRTQHRMSYDEGLGQVVLFGGYGSNLALNDTWIWDGLSWFEKNPIVHPPSRLYHALAYDAARNETVLFGGYNPLMGYNVGLGDTWIWNGDEWAKAAQWAKEAPDDHPSPRELAAMTFDQNLQEVILFGGGEPNSYTYYNQTWFWGGKEWKMRELVLAPEPRVGAEMVFDEANQCIVLFGGMNVAGQFLNDTWIWDGTSWVPVNPVHKPDARWKYGLAYDKSIDRVICFGGHGLSPLNDVWVWDGQDWQQILQNTAPPSRFGLGMAFDQIRSETIIYGGYNGGFLSDTWGLQMPNQPPVAQCKDIRIAIDENGQANITSEMIDAGSYDPDGDAISLSVDNGGPFGVGEYTVVLTVMDTPGGLTAACTAKVTVYDPAAITVRLVDHNGTGIEGGEVRWADGSWHAVGFTGADGTITFSPGNWNKISITYHQASVYKYPGDDLVWQTVPARIRLINHNGLAGLDGANVAQGGGFWDTTPGVTDSNGNVFWEVFPDKSYKFRVTYNYASVNNWFYIGTEGGTAQFQTGRVHSASGTCTFFAQGTWAPFIQDIELLPGATWHFKFNDGFPLTYYLINAGMENIIH